MLRIRSYLRSSLYTSEQAQQVTAWDDAGNNVREIKVELGLDYARALCMFKIVLLVLLIRNNCLYVVC